MNTFLPNWQFRETKKRLQLENTEYNRYGRRQAKTYQNVCIYIPGSIEISIIFWRLWTIGFPTQESGSAVCPFESSGIFVLQKHVYIFVPKRKFRGNNMKTTIFFWFLSSFSFLTYIQCHILPILVQWLFEG